MEIISQKGVLCVNEVKERMLKKLYQQLKLLAEEINQEDNVSKLRDMLCDFRHIAKTILNNNPTEEQRMEIFEMLEHQIRFLSLKKSVDLSDTINDLVNFVFYFF